MGPGTRKGEHAVKTVGIDIGTSTICGVVLDVTSGRIEQSVSLPNEAGLPGESWERRQDPALILAAATHLLDGAGVPWVHRGDPSD